MIPSFFLTTIETQHNFHRVAIGLGLLSVVTFLLSLILLPYIIRTIPADYFLQFTAIQPKANAYNLKSLCLCLIRNFFGFILLFCGIAMLFLPGQGLLTIFFSLLLLSFPGKKRLIRFLTRLTSVRRTINWVRNRANKKPIIWPPNC